MKNLRVLYKAWFPSAYGAGEANSGELHRIAESLLHDYGYDISVSKRGVIEIKLYPGRDGETGLPDNVIKSLVEKGMDVREIRYVNDIMADELFLLEAKARKWEKSILPIETLKNGLKIQWRDASYGNGDSEPDADDF